MFVKLIILTAVVKICLSSDVSESSDIDPIIYYLMNGEYEGEAPFSEEHDEPIFNETIWKCGQCEDIGDAKLIFSEMNAGLDVIDDPSVNIKIGVTVAGMKCITVRGTAGIVKGVEGNCEGPSVTLTVGASERFALNVYGE